MIQSSRADEIRAHHVAKRATIANSFHEPKTAQTITKAEFDEKYPAETFERYSLFSLTRFREELSKAEGENSEEAFKKATEDLKPFLVYHEGKRDFIFARKKEAGEK